MTKIQTNEMKSYKRNNNREEKKKKKDINFDLHETGGGLGWGVF